MVRIRVLNAFFSGTIILLGILGLMERLGLSSDLVVRILFALVLVTLLFAGVRARSVQTANMFVDGYRMTPIPNGLAIAMVATGAGIQLLAGGHIRQSAQRICCSRRRHCRCRLDGRFIRSVSAAGGCADTDGTA